MNDIPYDKTSKESIEEYGKQLRGKSFKNVLQKYKADNDNSIDLESLIDYYNNPRSKGSLGNLLEAFYFLYAPNSNPEADFNEAGVELKVTPYVINRNLTMKAKERLVLSMINYMEDYKLKFEDNHMYKKCALMLIIYYLYEPTKERLDYVMNYIKLFSFPETDLEIIKNDYYKIMTKIKEGKAHELSESDTNYLGACTKGANSSSTKEQPFSDIPAQSRAYCLKNSYMTYVLNEYIAKEKDNCESIIKDVDVLKTQSLEEYIISKLSLYYGQDVLYLRKKFNININIANKSFTYHLAKAMLEVVNDKIEEFEKANIQIKTIRIEYNGIIKQNMSFPAFKYLDIVNQEFEDSDIYNIFSNTKFLFIIYQYDKNGSLIFRKAMFWNVPYSDLNGEIKRVWNETKKRIINGNYDALPKIKESNICHVRPHGTTARDVYPTPNGTYATKKCFWLNRQYILKQIEGN